MTFDKAMSEVLLENYILTNSTVAPPGEYCDSEEDCKKKMEIFYQQVKDKLSGTHGGHGTPGEKGVTGDIGLKV